MSLLYFRVFKQISLTLFASFTLFLPTQCLSAHTFRCPLTLAELLELKATPPLPATTESLRLLSEIAGILESPQEAYALVPSVERIQILTKKITELKKFQPDLAILKGDNFALFFERTLLEFQKALGAVSTNYLSTHLIPADELESITQPLEMSWQHIHRLILGLKIEGPVKFDVVLFDAFKEAINKNSIIKDKRGAINLVKEKLLANGLTTTTQFALSFGRSTLNFATVFVDLHPILANSFRIPAWESQSTNYESFWSDLFSSMAIFYHPENEQQTKQIIKFRFHMFFPLGGLTESSKNFINRSTETLIHGSVEY
jgi:hypothetical protein